MNTKKILTAALALVLVAGISVGGTLAYLAAQTPEVKNTFTYGTVDLKLEEKKVGDNGLFSSPEAWVKSNTYARLVPGKPLDKNPTVTVTAKSEDCYVYVEVIDASKSKLNYAVNTSSWTKMSSVTGPNGGEVYKYKAVVPYSASATVLDPVLNQNYGETGHAVQVKPELSKADLADAEGTISFYAYAIQSSDIGGTAEAAWAAAVSNSDIKAALVP